MDRPDSGIPRDSFRWETALDLPHVLEGFLPVSETRRLHGAQELGWRSKSSEDEQGLTSSESTCRRLLRLRARAPVTTTSPSGLGAPDSNLSRFRTFRDWDERLRSVAWLSFIDVRRQTIDA